MGDLSKKECEPCHSGAGALNTTEIERMRSEVPGWNVVAAHHLEREYKFKDFKGALEFTNRLGQLAERQNHHPEIHLGWGHVKVQICTHSVDGLTENDFILAAKVDQLGANS